MKAFCATLLTIILAASSDASSTHVAKRGTVCIAGFEPVHTLSDYELTNKHPARDKSVFTLKFHRGQSLQVRAHETRAIALPIGRYRIQVMLDAKPIEVITAELRRDGFCLWYLQSSGWQVSQHLPDRAHGCECSSDRSSGK